VSAVAHAHPNIALIKYWGKADLPGNVPASPSLSITLDALTTTTHVREAAEDTLHLNGQLSNDAKVTACLENLRSRYDIPPLHIESQNNFPTAAGLASSASGFAALITAIDSVCELNLSPGERSVLAREASASAARSIFGGFVTLQAPDWQAQQILEPMAWPLEIVIAVSDTSSKAVSSSAGMVRSATAPYFSAWVETTHADFQAAVAAVETRKFQALADLAEHSCLKMHGLMMATRPGLLYWNAATMACLHQVRDLRAAGSEVFFTVDAGPQVKAICQAGHGHTVAEALGRVPGVQQVIHTGLGRGAWLEAK
jgi:diphosphomevalonate decarboxylase